MFLCDGFFFFSSRRRHTRWPRDWSSDVCSSDLTGATTCTAGTAGWRNATRRRRRRTSERRQAVRDEVGGGVDGGGPSAPRPRGGARLLRRHRDDGGRVAGPVFPSDAVRGARGGRVSDDERDEVEEAF